MGSCCSTVAMHPRTVTVQPGDRLITVVYVSRMVPGYFDDEKDVDIMVRFAGANNRSAGLSGFLLVASPFFLQRLEGPEARLRALIGGIKGDHRHDNFIVVEEKAITQRSYGSWNMRSFDLVKSADTKFEAVSFVLQSLSNGLTVAAKNIHPPIFDAMLSGRELTLRDDVSEMIVVTISLGTAVVHTTLDGKVFVDPEFICHMVHHLHRRICPLNPEGRGLVSVYGGTTVQLTIRRSQDNSLNLENKVVRACVELATGQGNAPTGQVRVYVSSGRVEEKYLCVGDDLRRGRFLRGEVLSRGVEVAKSLHAKAHPVAVQDAVAKRLIEEFDLETITGGLKAVTLRSSGVVVMAKALSGPGRQVRNCEGALLALMKHVEGQDRPRAMAGGENLSDVKTLDPAATTASSVQETDETDLEWMYQLDNLSKAYEKSLSSKKRKKPSKNAPGRYRRNQNQAVGQMNPTNSAAFGNTNLLNIIYLSKMSEDRPMSSAEIMDLGVRAAQANARINVTGFLLYTKPFFMQYLEGNPAHVKDLFSRIRTDPRHTNVTVIVSRIIGEAGRNFASWNMKTADLDSETSQETSPLREVLRLLTRQFNELKLWLPRLQNDMLLSSMTFQPGAYAQCNMVVFAAHTMKVDKTVGAMLESLVGFLNRGGELAGFLGPHLVGYAFGANIEMLVDEVADLCADFRVHVGIAVGNMMLINAGRDRDDCDVGLYGPLFERAQELADRAVKANVSIIAEKSCEVQVASLAWQPVDGLLHGRLEG